MVRQICMAGDHLGMLFAHGIEGAQGVRAFMHQT